MTPDTEVKPAQGPWVTVAIIFAFSAWAVGFNNTCQSDGCMGIVYPLGAALVALGVQVLVVVPLAAIRLSRAGQTFAAATLQWIIVSVAAGALPLLFVR